MTEDEPFQVVVTNVEEHEDGAATYSFEMTNEATEHLAKLGLEFCVYCASYGLDLQYVLENLKLIAEHHKEESKSEDSAA